VRGTGRRVEDDIKGSAQAVLFVDARNRTVLPLLSVQLMKTADTTPTQRRYNGAKSPYLPGKKPSGNANTLEHNNTLDNVKIWSRLVYECVLVGLGHEEGKGASYQTPHRRHHRKHPADAWRVVAAQSPGVRVRSAKSGVRAEQRAGSTYWVPSKGWSRCRCPWSPRTSRTNTLLHTKRQDRKNEEESITHTHTHTTIATRPHTRR
jgi:hypothetical protein